MPAISKNPRVCETCGSPIETTSSGDLGCTVCLFDAALDRVAEENDLAFPSAPDQLGVYMIEHRVDGSPWELGHGAMGITYRAIDRVLERPVALKLINTSLGSRSAEARRRFMREARAAAALRHPNVATVYQFGVREASGQFFYAMELIEGETLEERVRRLGPLDVLTTIDIALQVTAALAAAEEHGLVHRDLKPGNLMLTSTGNSVKVIDFGVAKAVTEKANAMGGTHGGFVGTPAFASPEQFADAQVDVRSDIYSLGATLWFLLTGQMLFNGRTIEELGEARQSKPLPAEQLKAARVPSRLVALLKSMLAIEPAARPGTQALAARLRHCAEQASGAQRKRILLAAVSLTLILGASAFFVSRSLKTHSSVTGSVSRGVAQEKSIAVLPFENRSEDEPNAYFADGVQDEILTRLSKIADLKVISRTSIQRYKSGPRNLPEIARQLGVANILEGTVRKSGDTVRVNVQLIKATDGSHLWAETFDRKLTDIFSVESDVAKAIADQLKAKLTGQEKQVIAAKPTNNTSAYDAYLRGLAYTLRGAITPANALETQKYLRQAVQLDPKFALAWALLSNVEARAYVTQALQPTVALREEARQAAETALTLQPNLGEAILAMGYYYYGCLKDYDTAVRYFEHAREFLPNSSRVPESLAHVTRRQGRWDKNEAYFNEAERLDPRNPNLFAQHALSYTVLRRFPEALRKYDQVLNITPDDIDTLAEKAAIAQAQGDLQRASAILAPLHPGANLNQALETQVYQAILERRPAPVIPRLKEILAKPDPALGYINGELRFWLGWAQEVGGDHAAAQDSWRQARSELEQLVKEQPDNERLIGDLALTNMGLGDKAGALALAEQAMAVNPIEKDAVTGPMPIEILARVAAQMGEPDRAVAALQKLLSIPYEGQLTANVPLTPALLRLDPMFDPLRSDQRFQEL